MGFDQGFDHFVESWQERWRTEVGERGPAIASGRVKFYTDATLVTDQALAWLRARDTSRPFFLWLHYMETHGPYLPPERYLNLFEGRHPSATIPPAQMPAYQRQVWNGQLMTDLAFYKAQYDREVRYLDDEIGRLLDALRELEIDNSLIVFTADHGESLGEHDYYLEHGLLSYQPTAQVPLIVVQPGRIEAGRSLEQPVGLIDVAATVVELAGLPLPASFEGTSLAGLLRGDSSAALPEYVFMESGYQLRSSQITIRHGRWKLIHVRSEEERALMSGSEYELYDLDADPAESENLASQHPEILERLRQELNNWYLENTRRAEIGPELDLESLDPRSREMLKALGYLESERGNYSDGPPSAGDGGG
jgi:arylsulfatase A-like enzyme